ncbi:hypothetical protein [Nocardia sp. NPDC005366]|uniref:hypothetical protein n=1 Tax=Nocardia sp. NPDC005366 TaxID=3156878 RepID=UPI0033AF264F
MNTSSRAASLMSTERRPRMSAEQVRDAMLKTAVEAVRSAGLTVSLDHISMDAVVLEAGVARSAAYRVWPQRSAFIMDLLLEVAKSSSVAHAAYDPQTLRTALDAVQPWRNKLTSVEARRAALIEASRTGVMRNFDALAEDEEWKTEIALRATMMSVPPDRQEELRDALDESVRAYINYLAQFYETMSRVLGYEMIPGRDFVYLAEAGSAIVEGMLLRGAGLPGTPNAASLPLRELFPADPFGTGNVQQWNAPTIAFTANILALIKPVAEFDAHGFDRWFDEVDQYVRDMEANPEFRHNQN